MNYYISSMFAIPSAVPQPSVKDFLYLYPLDQIYNQTLSDKDRKELNKNYQQTDIFVKRNSIVSSNIKRHKKYIAPNTALEGNFLAGVIKLLVAKQAESQQQAITGKQGLFFQEIHPSDVEKTHEDNMFDYRLHMKMGKGQQVFKVQQMKRKQKKRIISGKQCQCCGKQMTKSHKCSHSICQRKCGKANLRRRNSRKQGSSIGSESKDQNWSQQNYSQSNQMKKQIDSNSGKKQERSSGRKRGTNLSSHHSSNKESLIEPCNHYLASIDRLLTEQMSNSFTYRVIQIKQFFEQEQQQEQYQGQQAQEQMDIEMQEAVQRFISQQVVQNYIEAKVQKMQIREDRLRPYVVPVRDSGVKDQHVYKLNRNERGKYRSGEEGSIQKADNKKRGPLQLQSEEQLELQNQLKQQLMIKRKIKQKTLFTAGKSTEQAVKRLNNQPQKDQQQNYQQKDHISEIESKGDIQDYQRPKSQYKIQYKNSNPNPFLKEFIVVKEDPQIVKEQIIPDIERQSRPEMYGQVRNYQINQEYIKGNQIDQQLKPFSSYDKSQSLVDSCHQNSLDLEIGSIIQAEYGDNHQDQMGNQNNKKRQSIPHNLRDKNNTRSYYKKLNISARLLNSDMIEEVDPIEPEDFNNQQSEPQQQSLQEQSKKCLGQGKSRWLGSGKGILQEQLDIYQEDSRLLKNQNDIQNEDQQSDLIDIVQTKVQNTRGGPTNRKTNEHFQKNYRLGNFNTDLSDANCSNAGSVSSPSMYPSTPKRHFPNMDKIIQRMRQQSNFQLEQKGLGRGKVFGRGLGVLQQAQQLQKEQQADLLNDQDQERLDQKNKNGRKKVKIQESISDIRRKFYMIQDQQDDQGLKELDQNTDKFDQLMQNEQQIVQLQQCKLVLLISKESKINIKSHQVQQEDGQQNMSENSKMFAQTKRQKLGIKDRPKPLKLQQSDSEQKQQFENQNDLEIQKQESQLQGQQSPVKITQNAHNRQSDPPLDPREDLEELMDLFGGNLQRGSDSNI